jgi:large repetitive protein
VGFTKFIFILFMGTFGALALVNSANAYFSSQASGTGSAAVATLSPPTDVLATLPTPGIQTVDVSWTAPTEPTGITLDGYFVQRFVGSTPSPACGTSPTALISTVTCDDTNVDPNTYTYTVTAVFRSWTAESLPSSPIIVAAPKLTSFTLTPSTSTPTAGTAFTVAITALDQYGNVDVNYTGPECLTFSGPANSPDGHAPIYPLQPPCSSGSAMTFVNGVAAGGNSATMTLFDSQLVTLTATDNPTSADGTTGLNVLSAPTSVFDVANPGNQTVADPFSDTITAVDGYGNTVTSYSGPQTLVFSGPANAPNGAVPTYPSSVTFANGIGNATNITLFDAQTTSLTATQATITGTSTNFVVSAGSVSTFDVANPGNQTVGSGFDDTITALDGYGNVVTNYSGPQTLVFSGPANSPNGASPTYPTSVDFTAGVGSAANITLVDAQTTSLIAMQDTITGTSTNFVVSAGPATYLVVTAPSAAQTNTAFSVTVTAYDTEGNVDTSYNGTDNLVSSIGNILPTSVTLTNGVDTFNAKLDTIGIQAITATDTLTPSITGISGNIDVTAGAATTYTVTYNPNGPASGSVPVESNNPYDAGATVTVLANSGNLSESGATFLDWNTAANGSGTSYAPGSTFTINANTVLYAIFTQNAPPPIIIVQAAPFSNITTTTGSKGFSDQLEPTTQGANGVTFVTTVTNANLMVSSTGAVSTVGGYLKVGKYVVSGTDSDAAGGSGVWSYTLYVTPVTIIQTAPFASSVSKGLSSGFSASLAPTSENGNPVIYIVTSSNANLSVSSTGLVTVLGGPLAPNNYTVSGTDSDALGDTGTWNFTLTVLAPSTIVQSGPFSNTTTTTGSKTFTDQLEPTSQSSQTVTFVTTVTNANLSVTSSGAVSTVGGYLKVGQYVVSGTDSDAAGDSGTWSYTLYVTPVTIIQTAPFTSSVLTGSTSSFSTALAPTSENGNPVIYVVTSSNSHLSVSSAGKVTVTGGALPFGTYSVSGTDSDALGDSGTWTFTLKVTCATITQTAPFGQTVTTTGSKTVTDQLEPTTQGSSPITYVTTVTNANLAVSSSGAVSTLGGYLKVGNYVVSGTDSDALGDSGTWNYTLVVTPATIIQTVPFSSSVSKGSSSGFSATLAPTSENGNPVIYLVTVSNPHLSVSAAGKVSVTGGPLVAGPYTVSGTDTDALGDTGTWSFTLNVTSATIAQSAPLSNTTTTTGSKTFTDQLEPTTQDVGGVVYVTTVTNPNLMVSSSGAISTVGGYLKVGSYVVSGTDSDPAGDSGTWSYTLKVTPVTIIQVAPFSSSVSTGSAASFSTTLAPTSENANAVTFQVTVSNPNVSISGAGKVSVIGGPLKVGTYTVSGTDADALGDTGTWTYTLTVTAGSITQVAPFSATVSQADAPGFADQLQVSGATGTTTYSVTTSNPHLKVSASGQITTVGSLGAGDYTVSGTVTDSLGDGGTWTFTLKVTCQGTGKATLHLSPENPTSVVVGSVVNYVASVTASPGSGPLAGSVDFYLDGSAISGCQDLDLSGGQAHCSIDFNNVGSLTVSATYANDPHFAKSSDSSQQIVTPGATSVSLTPTASVAVGTKVTYEAKISETSGSGPLTGTVTFEENGTSLAGCTNVALAATSVTCSVTFAKGGIFTISAAYANDPNFEGSSTSILQNVGAAALAITTTSLADATPGQTGYSQTLEGAGGTPPYTWSVSTGSLPKGLYLNSTTGVISGTIATSAVTETFTVRLGDAAGAATTRQLTITIDCKPVITCGHSGGGSSGHFFNFQVTSWGGGNPTYGISGPLPRGLSFDAQDGTLSGTPAPGTDGTYVFTFTVSNPWGSTSQSFQLNIAG